MPTRWGRQARNSNDASQEQLISDHGQGRFLESQDSGGRHIPLQPLPAQARHVVENKTNREHIREEEHRGNKYHTEPSKSSSKDRRCDTIMAWMPELLSLLLAMLSLVAILIILVKFNRQQQPEWSFSSTINLSTILALLAATTQSMLGLVIEAVTGQLKWRWFKASKRPLNDLETFDNAGRGSWGSLRFLFKGPLLTWTTVGAWMTILSVGIGIFTQQALQTYSCPKPASGGLAQMPIAQTSFDAVNRVKEGSGADPIYTLSLELRAALIAGFAGAQTSGILTATCSTGNCTFDAVDEITYSSATIGSECVDASSLLGQSGQRDWVTNFDTSQGNDTPISTTYTFPWIPGINVSYNVLNGTIGSSYGRWRNLMSFGSLYELGTSSPYFEELDMTMPQRQRVNASFDSIVFVMPTINPCADPSDYQEYFEDYEETPMPPVDVSLCPELHMLNVSTFPGYFTVSATVCFFYPYVENFNGSVVNGRAQEETVGEPILMQAASGSDVSIGTADPLFWYALLDPCVVDDGVVYTSSNYTAGADLVNITGTLVPARCVYGFAYPWYKALESTSALSFSISGTTDADPDTCGPYENYTQMSCARAWWLNGVYHGGNASAASVGAFLGRGFAAFTDQLRMLGSDWDGAPLRVSGRTWHNVVCTRFHWEWLLFPLVVVCGTVVVLLSVLVTGPGAQEAVWKSSILPLLFYGLEERERLGEQRLWSAGQLTAAAKKLEVKFRLGGKQPDGWRLWGVAYGLQPPVKQHSQHGGFDGVEH